MAHTPIRLFLPLVFILTLLTAFVPSGVAQALTDPYDEAELPSLDDFIRQVSNGQAGELRGIYIPGILAAPVVQQPAGINEFVSPRHNVVTQFGLTSKVGSTGLLAHNDLAGQTFGLLQKGQELKLVDGSGKISTFIVTEVLRYQAMIPGSTTTRFLDLKSETSITAAALFNRIYNRPGQVILQTCIQADGDSSWGRLFVIAAPAN
jgi:hypothetical protein